MNKLKTLIVDDEKNARNVLQNFIQSYCPSLDIVDAVKNTAEAKEVLEAHEIDLMFLDIEMPHQNGIDFLNEMHQSQQLLPYVIFVTAYNEHAIQALKLNALDYLLKPVDIEELITAVNKAGMEQQQKLQQENTIHLLENISIQEQQKKKITLPHLNGFDVVPISEIIMLKADNNYTEVYIKGQKPAILSKTLKHFEDILEKVGFFRVHKSYLVNLNHIEGYQNGKGGQLNLSEGLYCELAPSKKKSFLLQFQKMNEI